MDKQQGFASMSRKRVPLVVAAMTACAAVAWHRKGLEAGIRAGFGALLVLALSSGFIRWGNHSIAVARLARRARPIAIALTKDGVVDGFGWKDSARILLRTLLLAIASITLVRGASSSDGQWTSVLDVALRNAFAALPVLGAAAWIVLDAVPERRPPGWPDAKQVSRPWQYLAPAVVFSAVTTSAVGVLWEETSSGMILVTGCLLVGLVVAPYLVGSLHLTAAAWTLASAHARNFVRRWPNDWVALSGEQPNE